jgi:hypothetical protein
MTRQGFEAVNGRQVADALGDLGKDAADLSAPTRTVLSVGLDAARGAAPRLTGALIGGLDVVDVTPEGGTLVAAAPHSRYQEYGTRYVKARRFMAAGSEAIHAAAGDIYRDDLAAKIGKAASKA